MENQNQERRPNAILDALSRIHTQDYLTTLYGSPWSIHPQAMPYNPQAEFWNPSFGGCAILDAPAVPEVTLWRHPESAEDADLYGVEYYPRYRAVEMDATSSPLTGQSQPPPSHAQTEIPPTSNIETQVTRNEDMTTVTAEAPEHSKTVTDILPEDTTYTLKFPSEPVLQKIWLSVIFAHNRNLSNLYRARKAIAKTVKDAGSSSRVRSQNHKSLKKVDALSLRQVMSAAFTTSGSSTPTAPVYVSKTENAVILEFFSMKHDAAQKTLEVTVPKGTDLNLLKRYSPMTRLLERLGRRQWRGDCGGMLIGIEFSAASSSPPADVAALVADATDEPVDESETFEL